MDGSRLGDLDGPPEPNEAIDLVLTELPSSQYRISSWLHRIGLFFPCAKVVLLTEGPTRPEVVRSALAGGAHGYVDKDISFAAMHAIIDAVLHGQIVCPPLVRDQLLSEHDLARKEEEAAAGDGDDARQPEPVRAIAQRDEAVVRWPSEAARAADLRSAQLRSQARPLPRPLPQSQVARRLVGEPEVGLSERETEILHHLTEGHANKIIAHRMSISEATVKSHLKSLLRKLHFSNRTQAAIWAVNRYRPTIGAAGDFPAEQRVSG